MSNNNNLVFNVPFSIKCPNEESNIDMNDVIIRGKYHLPISPDIYNCNVLDIGGGYGSFAIWSLLSNNKWKNQTIYIYEPNKDNYKILKQNMKTLSEKLKFDVKTFNYAVSETCSEDHIEGSGLQSYVAETLVNNFVHIPINIDTSNNTENNIDESDNKVVEIEDDVINKIIEETINEHEKNNESNNIIGESFGGNIKPEKQIKLISCDRLPKADVVKININKGNYEILRGLIKSQQPIIILVAFENDQERSNIDKIMCYENSPYRLFDVDRKIIQKNGYKYEIKGILKYIKM